MAEADAEAEAPEDRPRETAAPQGSTVPRREGGEVKRPAPDVPLPCRYCRGEHSDPKDAEIARLTAERDEAEAALNRQIEENRRLERQRDGRRPCTATTTTKPTTAVTTHAPFAPPDRQLKSEDVTTRTTKGRR